MSNDLEILTQLENGVGKKFKCVDFDNLLRDHPQYSMDENQHVIGLNLDSENLKEFPLLIVQLTHLKKLRLSNNQILEIPPEICQLGDLDYLSLRHNKIAFLPESMTKLNLDFKEQWAGITEIGISVDDNPLESPPIEIVQQGKTAVIEYFRSLKGKQATLNEVKVLLVGDGGSGKTSILKCLVGEKFNPNQPQTHGINIVNKNFISQDKLITVHFWDFGGQEIMHATHQFFLSKRSLYILVLDGRKEEDAEYWLKLIESFGGNSQILVALNKIDENPGFEINRRFLQEKYPGIKGFYRTSCLNGNKIRDLKGDLCKALADVEIIKTTWATNWFNVKMKLEQMSDDFISYDQYIDICDAEQIATVTSQDTLVEFLNDLGSIVHFKDFRLSDTYVLNPKWVTTGVYKIITSIQLAQSHGILRLSSLGEVLKKIEVTDYFYPRNRYKFLIDLMMKFELCYELDRSTVLIPDLLDVQEPLIHFDYSHVLKFILKFDFLPKSIIPRFVVKMHTEIKDSLCWRTGVVLESRLFHSTALIKADEQDNKIYIYVNGEQKRDYFSIIRNHFTDITNSFEKLNVTELFPLPDRADIVVEYNDLIGYELAGRDELFIGKLRKSYSVKALLNGIEKEEIRAKKEAYIINVGVMEVDTMGDKFISGRDTINIEEAQVNQLTTGAGDHLQDDARKFMQAPTPQSSPAEIVELLSFIQKELSKSHSLSEELKEEVINEVKGAEIQVNKIPPDKEKAANKLRDATEALKESAKTFKEAATIGNILGKAIIWCGAQWTDWTV